MKNYLFSIGGSGSKVVEALLHMNALGILTEKRDEEISVIFIDLDGNNGNYTRTDATSKICKELREALPETMKRASFIVSNWMPASGTGNYIASMLGFSNELMDQGEKGDLLGILKSTYADEELLESFDVGFKGHPNIGKAYFSLELPLIWENPNDALRVCIDSIVSSKESSVKVMLAGSIFGGTGASAIPALVETIREKKKEKDSASRSLGKKSNLNISSILMLPYFSLQDAGAGDESMRISSGDFIAKVKSGLEYYAENGIVYGEGSLFDSVYLAGSGNGRPSVYAYHEGKSDQRNCANIAEIVAGKEYKDYLGWDIDSEPKKESYRGLFICDAPLDAKGKWNWASFSDVKFFQCIGSFLNISIYLALYGQKLMEELSRKRKVSGDFKNYFNQLDKDNKSTAAQKLSSIAKYLKCFVNWFSDVISDLPAEFTYGDPTVVCNIPRNSLVDHSALDDLKIYYNLHDEKFNRINFDSSSASADPILKNIIALSISEKELQEKMSAAMEKMFMEKNPQVTKEYVSLGLQMAGARKTDANAAFSDFFTKLASLCTPGIQD
ncbi:MAG: hypothetical protein LBU32_29100 [Clostridiales bacterium]|nr:hypothetical protein [Clostridiales bacterium]